MERLERLRTISICHRGVVNGDAIGNDIVGTYRLLERMGFSPTVLCEMANENIRQSLRVDHNLDPRHVSTTYDCLIYHHSIEWLDGEAIINAFAGPIIAKYHNITSPEFFKPYATKHEQDCRAGRDQTARLVVADKVMLWQADSAYNAEELKALGVSPKRLVVVPPFTRISDTLSSRHCAAYSDGQRVELLFVGRRSPNKGHRHLLYILNSYVQLFSRNVTLKIVGGVDDLLSRYSDELLALADRLGVAPHIQWLTDISDDKIDDLFRSSHVYVSASEHEGFCVPIVEAQSIGLPVITANTTAVRETAGANQIVCPLPACADDYDLMAGLIHEVVTNHHLRNQLVRHGFRNAYERFSQETTEDLFVSSLEPIWRMA